MKCLRCSHEWMSKVKEPKRCPKCKSPYWNKPKLPASSSNYGTQRLIAQIDSLHEEVANERHLKEQLLAERLPPTKVLTEPLDPHPIIHLLPKLYAPLKNHLIIAMRDKYPEIKFELKGNEIIEIL